MKNSDKKYIYVLMGLPVVVVAFLVGLYVGGSNPEIRNSAATNSQFITSNDFSPFWKTWQILDEKHVNSASTTKVSKVWGSIQGLVSSYGDPYTIFFPPTQSKLFNENIAGDFGGIGMEVGLKDNQLVVVSPLKGNPAEAAGVKAGDAILSINGTSTDNMAVDQAVSYIRGPKGTKVKIVFLPKGASKPVERTIVRATISVPTLDTVERSDGIFVIKLYSFTSQSPELFRVALRKFVLSGSHKLVLDLRGNPGGYLDAAWDMASYFLPTGKVVVTESFGQSDRNQVFRSKGYNAFNNNLKMMILVDSGSASAAEILAGALQEHGVAKLVGTKTFGKGSVQELIPITSDTSLKVTVAKWLTPKGHNLSHDGLEPDYIVSMSDEDTRTNKDPQTNKAIELLKALP